MRDAIKIGGVPRDKRNVRTFARKRARYRATYATACAGDHHNRAWCR
jgi:hypothetical protein